MRMERLVFLAGRHEPKRKIIKAERESLGGCWVLNLECGHGGKCNPHFDMSNSVGGTWNCRECGIEYVKSAPQYAKEFID